VSGSGISWAVCKPAPRSRQITMPAPHHSVFYRPDGGCPPNQHGQSTEGLFIHNHTLDSSRTYNKRRRLVWAAAYRCGGRTAQVCQFGVVGGHATHVTRQTSTDDNGSAGHGSSGSTNLSGSRVSTRDSLTHDQVHKIPRTG